MPSGMCLCRIVPTAAPEVASTTDDCCDHCDRSHSPPDEPRDDGNPTPSLPDCPGAPCAFMAAAGTRPPTPEPVSFRRDLAAGNAVSAANPGLVAGGSAAAPARSHEPPWHPPAFISHCALLL
jgi:hypothetical protein